LGLELGAEGAVGLEGAEFAEGAVVGALGAGVVAGKAGEGGGGEVVEEGVGTVGGQLGFQTADAAEGPGGVEKLVEQVVLEGALGLELGLEGVLEVLELVLLVFVEDDVVVGEAVGRFAPGEGCWVWGVGHTCAPTYMITGGGKGFEGGGRGRC